MKFHDLKADLAVAQASMAEARAALAEQSLVIAGLLQRNEHQAKLIDQARTERDTSNDLLSALLDQLDRDLGAEREGPLSDLRREGRAHVG